MVAMLAVCSSTPPLHHTLQTLTYRCQNTIRMQQKWGFNPKGRPQKGRPKKCIFYILYYSYFFVYQMLSVNTQQPLLLCWFGVLCLPLTPHYAHQSSTDHYMLSASLKKEYNTVSTWNSFDVLCHYPIVDYIIQTLLLPLHP